MAARRRQRQLVDNLQSKHDRSESELHANGCSVDALKFIDRQEQAGAAALLAQRRVTRAASKAAAALLTTAQPSTARMSGHLQQVKEQGLEPYEPCRKKARTRTGAHSTKLTLAGHVQPASGKVSHGDAEMQDGACIAPTSQLEGSKAHRPVVSREAGGVIIATEDGVCATAGGSRRNKRKDKAGTAVAGATRELEQQLWNQGYTCVIGVDEAGRGPLAGPVVAAACVIPTQVSIPGVADSKQLSEEEREALYDTITQTPGVLWAVHVVDHTSIDRINILQATLLGMREATLKLPPDQNSYILVDGNKLPKDLPAPAHAVIKGDMHCYCIAAASILAKVTRDRLMLQYHAQYPQYGFDKHKGYAVPAHYTALAAHGPCDIHRRSFQPISGCGPTDPTNNHRQEERTESEEGKEGQQRGDAHIVHVLLDRGMTGWTRDAQLAEEQAAAAAAGNEPVADSGAAAAGIQADISKVQTAKRDC